MPLINQNFILNNFHTIFDLQKVCKCKTLHILLNLPLKHCIFCTQVGPKMGAQQLLNKLCNYTSHLVNSFDTGWCETIFMCFKNTHSVVSYINLIIKISNYHDININNNKKIINVVIKLSMST